MSNTQIQIGYGPMLDPIEDQLKDQGFTVKDADKYEKQRHAINVLYITGLLPESQAHKARQKLHNRIMKDLVPLTPKENE